MNTTTISKQQFYDAVAIHLNKNIKDILTSDVSYVMTEFGFKIKWSFATSMECEILKEKEFFLHRIKYGF
jgi:hypothetical protein